MGRFAGEAGQTPAWGRSCPDRCSCGVSGAKTTNDPQGCMRGESKIEKQGWRVQELELFKIWLLSANRPGWV